MGKYKNTYLVKEREHNNSSEVTDSHNSDFYIEQGIECKSLDSLLPHGKELTKLVDDLEKQHENETITIHYDIKLMEMDFYIHK